MTTTTPVPTPHEKPLAPLQAVDPGQRILLKGGTIVSMDAKVGDLAEGDLLIEGTKIAAISPELSVGDAEIIDATNMIIIPGFVDCHRHCWEGQLRRISPNATLGDYVKATHFAFAPFYRPSDIYVGNLLTALGGIDAGITTIIDNCHNSRSDAHSDAAVEALLDAGIRAVHAPAPPLIGTWDEARWPYDHLARLQRKYFISDDQLLTLAMMSQIDRGAWAVARRLGLRIVTEIHGPAMATAIESLHRDGLLGPDNIFNHCTALPEKTWEILREAGVSINVCPRSDPQYGIENGMSAYQDAIDNGIKPGFSIDNETSYSGDMFGEMRAAFYLQRATTQSSRVLGHQVPEPVMVRELLEAATVNGAACAGLAERVGSLTPGKQADIVMIRTDDINLYPSNNTLGTVVQAAERGNVDTVFIGGRARKKNGRIVGLDMAALKRVTEESREHLFTATGYHPDTFCAAHDGLVGQDLPISSAWVPSW